MADHGGPSKLGPYMVRNDRLLIDDYEVTS